MAALSSQAPAMTGVAPTYNAVASSDTVPNPSGKTVLHVKNGNASADVVTLVGQGKIEDITVPNRTVSVPAGAERWIGPLSAAMYNDANGNVTVQHSITATVTMAVIQLP